MKILYGRGGSPMTRPNRNDAHFMLSFRKYIQTTKYLFIVVMQSLADDDLSRTCISLHNEIAYLKNAAAPSKKSHAPCCF